MVSKIDKDIPTYRENFVCSKLHSSCDYMRAGVYS